MTRGLGQTGEESQQLIKSFSKTYITCHRSNAARREANAATLQVGQEEPEAVSSWPPLWLATSPWRRQLDRGAEDCCERSEAASLSEALEKLRSQLKHPQAGQFQQPTGVQQIPPARLGQSKTCRDLLMVEQRLWMQLTPELRTKSAFAAAEPRHPCRRDAVSSSCPAERSNNPSSFGECPHPAQTQRTPAPSLLLQSTPLLTDGPRLAVEPAWGLSSSLEACGLHEPPGLCSCALCLVVRV